MTSSLSWLVVASLAINYYYLSHTSNAQSVYSDMYASSNATEHHRALGFDPYKKLPPKRPPQKPLHKAVKVVTTARYNNHTNFTLSPPVDAARRELYGAYRQSLTAHNSAAEPPKLCGIIWSLSSVNGTKTDFREMAHFGRGEGKYRLLRSATETIASAVRVKNSLKSFPDLPEHCGSQNQLELTLFTERSLLTSLKDREHPADLLKEAQCVFDKIVYFDDIPAEVRRAAFSKPFTGKDTIIRLPPQPMASKLLSLLSTPYQYTLFLDGDTAPCLGFQMKVFQLLKVVDIMSTENVFGYDATKGLKTYAGAPQHPEYENFVERNTGIFAFRWNKQVEKFLSRALELVPFFGKMGFVEDQAMIRHSLFESLKLDGLKEYRGRPEHYCRFGWSCEENTCKKGCVIIHQRKCVSYGVSGVHRNGRQACALDSEALAKRIKKYEPHINKAFKKNDHIRNSGQAVAGAGKAR